MTAKIRDSRWTVIVLMTVFPILIGLLALFGRGMSIFDSRQMLVLDKINGVPIAFVASIPYWYDLVFVGLMGASLSALATSRLVKKSLEIMREDDGSMNQVGKMFLGEFLTVTIIATVTSLISGVLLITAINTSIAAVFGLMFGMMMNFLPAQDRRGIIMFPLAVKNLLATAAVLMMLGLLFGSVMTAGLSLALIVSDTGPIITFTTSVIMTTIAGVAFIIGLLPGLVLATVRMSFSCDTARA